MLTIQELLTRFPADGELVWIGLRPQRGAPMTLVDSVQVEPKSGLVGDRHHGIGKRQVTLIQFEHLPVLTALLGKSVEPEMLRRNLVVKGVNLLALKDRSFKIGTAVFQCTGLCQPCSKMERILGPGGYNAMRGHGGLTARIVEGGWVRVGDRLTVVPDQGS